MSEVIQPYIGFSTCISRAPQVARIWNLNLWEETLHYAFVPTGTNALELFVLTDGRMQIWRYRFSREQDEKGKWVVKGEWRRTAHGLEVAFRKPFSIHRSEYSYCFVTHDGELHRLRRTSGGKWESESLYQQPSDPIIALVYGDDLKTAYAFGKTFYFKLSGDPERRSCRDVTAGESDLGEPLRTVLECARIVQDTAAAR